MNLIALLMKVNIKAKCLARYYTAVVHADIQLKVPDHGQVSWIDILIPVYNSGRMVVPVVELRMEYQWESPGLVEDG